MEVLRPKGSHDVVFMVVDEDDITVTGIWISIGNGQPIILGHRGGPARESFPRDMIKDWVWYNSPEAAMYERKREREADRTFTKTILKVMDKYKDTLEKLKD